MKNLWEVFVCSIKSATKDFVEVFALILLMIFGVSIACIEIYVFCTNMLLGIILFFPLLFIGLVVINFWFNLANECKFYDV